MLSKEKQIERSAIVRSALASQRIEGLEPDATVIEDAQRWARGEITIDAAVAAYKARVRNEMKYAGDGGAPYLDKDTGVLRNLLGIKDQAGLDKLESSLSFLRTSELAAKPVKGRFDLAHLQKIHQYLFRDIYAWAGQIRQVEIQKGNTIFAR